MKALKTAAAGAALLAGIGTARAALVAPPHLSTKAPIDWSQMFAAEQEQIAHLRSLAITYCSASVTPDNGLAPYATPDTETVGGQLVGRGNGGKR